MAPWSPPGRASFLRAVLVVEPGPCARRSPRENGLDILTHTLGPEGGHRWWNDSATVRERALRLTGDPRWRERALAWIDTYRAQHGRGPRACFESGFGAWSDRGPWHVET
ncbi:hypothetical protein GCM10010387_33110 [Streptomyces inusitatus]|uniref:Uncharacterized protein n=1 Tax=Streptomyces inusitatus TaxID=68221 RepID=A0A918UVT4_9ACTN|nr:hypothetical protein GCM10010387_33110 [Streptomyces inusitatus]